MPFNPGFNFDEAKECLALSANVESKDTPSTSTNEVARNALQINHEGNAPSEENWPLPTPKIDNWKIAVKPTESIGLDNYWRLYQSKENPHCYAVAIRGTVEAAKSVIADLMVGMIKAESSLQIKESGDVSGYTFNFKLAEQQYAGVHHGFAYSLGALINPNWKFSLIKHLKDAVENGATEIYITGHSQGAAIATLLRSYLEYQPIGNNISYKTYVFAQPKPGNDYLQCDFDQLFATPMLAFRLINSLDWVPQAPLTVELLSDINTPNPVSTAWYWLADLLRIADRFIKRIFGMLIKTENSEILLGSVDPSAQLTTKKFSVLSLNYSGMANPVSLRGNPKIGEEHKDDMFAQHHLGTYWALMKQFLT